MKKLPETSLDIVSLTLPHCQSVRAVSGQQPHLDLLSVSVFSESWAGTPSTFFYKSSGICESCPRKDSVNPNTLFHLFNIYCCNRRFYRHPSVHFLHLYLCLFFFPCVMLGMRRKNSHSFIIVREVVIMVMIRWNLTYKSNCNSLWGLSQLEMFPWLAFLPQQLRAGSVNALEIY